MRIRVVLPALAVLAVVAATAGAANRVEVHSMSALPGADIAVGVYVENDVEVVAVSVPLIIKSVNPNAYMTALSLVNPVPGSRMVGKLAEIVQSNTYPVGGVVVSGCNSAWYTDGGGFATPGPADYNSPDGVFFGRQTIGGQTRLPAGSDFPIETGIPSFRLNITVTLTPGTFEIDTTCVTPANHLGYISNTGTPVVPTFSKGTITICPCPWQGDFDEDGDIDAVDLARDIDITYFGGLDIQDPECPTTRCDWNANGFVDAVDLAKWINYVFFAGADPVNPCE